MRWVLLGLFACGGGSGGITDAANVPEAPCDLALELSGARNDALTATGCGRGTPGHVMLFSFPDQGVTVRSAQLSTADIAVGPHSARFEYRERRSGDDETWVTDECALEISVSERLGEVDVLGDPKVLFRVVGVATCPPMNNGSELTAAPFQFEAGALD